MKGIWKVFELDHLDVLVSKHYNNDTDKYGLDYKVCVDEIGNYINLTIAFDNEDALNKAFEKQSVETVSKILDYFIGDLMEHSEPIEILLT